MISREVLKAQVLQVTPFLVGKDYEPFERFCELASDSKTDEELALQFEFLVWAHFLSVGTFVPTDVDLLIRQTLWRRVHHEKDLASFWAVIQRFKTSDDRRVSKRFVEDFATGQRLCGHQGEWFTLAVPAYASALKHRSHLAEEIRIQIEEEFERERSFLFQLKERFLSTEEEEAKLKAMISFSAGIAAMTHNLGDLDRMISECELSDHDVLKRRVYRAAHEDSRAKDDFLIQAGLFYQKFLAKENHRHFSLRSPKGLRESEAFLSPYGPFYDEWGEVLSRLGERDLREVIVALVEGWKGLNQKGTYESVGYTRALSGIGKGLKGDASLLSSWMPPKVADFYMQSGLKSQVDLKRKTFHQQWQRRFLQAFDAKEVEIE